MDWEGGGALDVATVWHVEETLLWLTLHPSALRCALLQAELLQAYSTVRRPALKSTARRVNG